MYVPLPTDRVFLADGIDELRRMPAKSVSAIITDPPYSNHVHSKQTRFTRSNLRDNGGTSYTYDLGFEAISAESRIDAALAFVRATSGWIILFTDAESVTAWKLALEYAGAIYKRTCIWVKPTYQPQLTGDRPAQGYESICCAYGSIGRSKWNGGGKAGVYYSAPQTGRFHPTQKPLDLMCRLVNDFTSIGDLVVDPYAGSGTTIAACKRLARRSIGFETNPRYVDLANARIEKTECMYDDVDGMVEMSTRRRAKQLELLHGTQDELGQNSIQAEVIPDGTGGSLPEPSRETG